MKHVYILQMARETEDEVSMEIYAVYTTREKAISIGMNLVSEDGNGYVYYYVSQHLIFQ